MFCTSLLSPLNAWNCSSFIILSAAAVLVSPPLNPRRSIAATMSSSLLYWFKNHSLRALLEYFTRPTLKCASSTIICWTKVLRKSNTSFQLSASPN
jgi:hypothetical protein